MAAVRPYVGRSVAAAVAALVFASVTVAQGDHQSTELSNFHQVNEKLYRGAQPRDGGLLKLRGLGVRTIINLRGEDERSRAEEAEARALGLRYFGVPMAGHARPTDAQVARVLEIIDAPENQPVFVHCKRGADRTGTIIALYRVTHDGWTSEAAKAEANRYGMRWTQAEMKDYITDYYERRTMGGVHARRHRRTHVAGEAAETTRRALEKSYSFMRKGLRRVKHSL